MTTSSRSSANSNRAASLTRQLLAFSRQQTLRPQVLQLPDVISEVSQSAQAAARRDGEARRSSTAATSAPVRADPGQLEQVVVNLAVNARDAMLAKDPRGGGTLTITDLRGHRRRRAQDGQRHPADRRLYRARDRRYRHRHPARHPRQDLRAVLHHQGSRQGHRPRPLHRLRHRQAIGRLHLRRQPAGAGRELHRSTCPSTRAGRRRRRRAGAAPRRSPPICGAPARSCWSRTRTWSAPSPSAR